MMGPNCPWTDVSPSGPPTLFGNSPPEGGTSQGRGRMERVALTTNFNVSTFPPQINLSKPGPVPAFAVNTTTMNSNAFLPTVVAAVRNPQTEKVVPMVCLLDPCCSGLVITKTAAQQLKVGTWAEMVTIKVLEATSQTLRQNCELDLLSLAFPRTQVLRRKAVVVDSIPIDERSIPVPEDIRKWPFMSDVALKRLPHRHVDIIMGVDLAFTWCLPKDFRRGGTHQPMAILTDWGWTLLGGQRSLNTTMSTYLVQVDNEALSAQLDRLFTQDFSPLPGDQDVDKLSMEDLLASDLIEKSTRLQGGRYEVAVPWRWSKSETSAFMNSIDSSFTARKRLQNLSAT